MNAKTLRKRLRIWGGTQEPLLDGCGQNGTASAKTKSGGVDPVAVLCGVLADESASLEERTEAAWLLLPFYHPRVVKMASLLRIFLLGPLLTRSLCDQRQ